MSLKSLRAVQAVTATRGGALKTYSIERRMLSVGGKGRSTLSPKCIDGLPQWFPGRVTDRIEAPTLVVAAENDGLIPVQGVRDADAKLKRGEYVELKGADHFSSYTGPVFEQVVAKQTAFFRKNLMGQ